MTIINKLNLPDYRTWKRNYLKSQRHKDFLKEVYAFEDFKPRPRLHPRVKSLLECKNIGREAFSYIDETDFTWTSYWFEYILSTVNADELVLDIGCGENIFKKIYPEYNILGSNPIGDESFGCDFRYQFDNKSHNSSLSDLYSNVGGIVSFNSTHFAPVSGVAENCKTLVEALKPGGQLVLSISSHVVFNNKLMNSFKMGNFSEERKTKSYYSNYLLDNLTNSEGFDVVYFDTRFDTFEHHQNTGDIHIVLQKA